VGGYILHEDGRPKLDPLGNPVMLIGVVARENVELRGNWNVLGLRGTGSYDFHVPEQAVHQDYFFDPATAAPLRGGALYRMGFLAIPALCHASFGSGCSLRMLDEWALYARGKSRGPGKTISEMDTFRRDLAVSTAAHRSAEEYIRSTYRQLFASATDGGPSPQQVLDSQLSASNMITVGTRIAQTAFTSSATTGLRNGSVLQRGFRDMQAANAHILTSEQSYIDAGAQLATEPPYICGSTPNS
jgi:alkylation response protein AidB-like acyl-CoA dehydrogenase